MVIFLSDESESSICSFLGCVLFYIPLNCRLVMDTRNLIDIIFGGARRSLSGHKGWVRQMANVVYRFRNRLMMSLLSVYFILFYFHKCRQAGQTKFVRSAVKWSLPHAINAPELRWVETFLKTHWYFAVGAHLSRGNWAKFQNNQLFFGWAP